MKRLLSLLLSLAAIGFCLPAVSFADDGAGFKPIFNGQNLEGWDGNLKFWSVKDGAIQGQTTSDNPTSGNTFLIWRDGNVDNFVIRLQYRIKGGNSGIQYRSKELDKWVIGGYQGDFEAGNTYSGINYEERGRGILANRGQKVTIGPDGKKEETQVTDSADLQKSIKKEDWNDYEIIADGDHLTHKINGRVTSEVIDRQQGAAARSGLLALQLHAGPPMTVEFKNVRLKRTKFNDGYKKIVLVAGTPSHGPGDHEFNAGSLLLKKCLDQAAPQVVSAVYLNGWPKDPTAFDNADSILLYMDGGNGHPVVQRSRLAELDELMKRGVGLCCAHYAVEVPKEKGGPDFLKWIGGYYETGFSINPHWVGDFKEIPQHPVTSGVKPFQIKDEWYYNIRFPEKQEGLTPLLIAQPPDEGRRTPAAKERAGKPEIVAWVYEREGNGRGFGFTGGHFHKNWGNENFRKLVLNALLWTAHADVPTSGVESSVTDEDLAQNLDKKR
jgi:type 1 glutamine amidotransferase